MPIRFFCILLLILTGCLVHRPAVEDLSGKEDLSFFKLQFVRGTRDGDRLTTVAFISDSSSNLTLDMRFAVGSPTKLDSGSWLWTRKSQNSSGNISARSVTFLGGQDGPPSIGGSFDLVNPDGLAVYRVNIPVTELKRQ
jgi:hypothetical protein